MEFIGLDIHRAYTVLARMDAAGQVREHKRLDNEALPAYLQALESPPSVALEATANWYNIFELVEPLAAEVALGHPLKTRIIAEAKVKTDKVDATILAHLLRADLLPRAYMAPAAVRELRELLRLHASLVRLRTSLRNKIHAVLIKRGLRQPGKKLFTKKGLRWLRDTCEALPTAYALAITSYLSIEQALCDQIVAVDREIDARAEASEEAVWLDSIPGIGHYFALLILAEIGDIRRFPDAAHLASYAGLVPSVHSSGGRTKYGPLTRQGSAWLRWAMVEAARSASRTPGPLKDRYDRTCKRKNTNTAAVDLARFMLGCVFTMLSERRPFRTNPRGS
jgi:transposase